MFWKKVKDKVNWCGIHQMTKLHYAAYIENLGYFDPARQYVIRTLGTNFCPKCVKEKVKTFLENKEKEKQEICKIFKSGE